MGQIVAVLVFFFGALAPTFGIGKAYSDARKELEIAAMNTTKISQEAELRVRDREIQQLMSEKASLLHAKQALLDENAEYKGTVADLTQTITRIGLCEPFRSQMSEAIRVHGQTKERLLLLETAHKDYRVEKEQVDTTRQQVADLEKNIRTLQGQLVECQDGPTRQSASLTKAKPSSTIE